MKTKFALFVIFILFGTLLQASFVQTYAVGFIDNTTIFDDAYSRAN
jgi:hypothetical protein